MQRLIEMILKERLDFQEAPTCDVPELEPQSEVLVPADHLGQKIGAYRRSEIKKTFPNILIFWK